MDQLTQIKIALMAVATTVSAWMWNLAMPVLVMVGVSMIDYATGLVASPYRNQPINSYKGIKGIAKKVCMWLLVVVGVVVDWVLLFMGITLPVPMPIATLVAMWIITNELISILENIGDIGVPLPPFLKKIVALVKSQTEKAVDTLEEQEMHHE